MTGNRPASLRLALALALVLLSACSDDDGDPDAASTTTSTTEPPTTTTSAPTTTTGVPCPAAEIPAGVTDVNIANGDVDGDGAIDTLRTYLLDGDWHLHAELEVGGDADVVLSVAPGGAAAVIGGADVDGDGADEVWARVGSGASATIVGLARFDACSLTSVVLPNGEPVQLPVGGSVGSPAGLECGHGADLTEYTAFLGDDDTYDITATPYDLAGSVLTAGTATTLSVDADDDAMAQYTGLSCGDLVL